MKKQMLFLGLLATSAFCMEDGRIKESLSEDQGFTVPVDNTKHKITSSENADMTTLEINEMLAEAEEHLEKDEREVRPALHQPLQEKRESIHGKNNRCLVCCCGCLSGIMKFMCCSSCPKKADDEN